MRSALQALAQIISGNSFMSCSTVSCILAAAAVAAVARNVWFCVHAVSLEAVPISQYL